ncbi:NUDIX hydrolase [Sorangium sp. So ce1151]|uniref:NUDIX hydrolase n=1 Tax=Sorangium sp. So ce1151 TaxID=3133332 RepID=UPI003F624CD6
MIEKLERVATTLIYAVRDGRALMLYRHKEPNLGLWIAPGGKVEIDESPFECARRELREETGLDARRLIFRGLVTLVSPRVDWQWALHLFVAPDPAGDLAGDEREGRLRWWPLEEIPRLPIPESDARFYPAVIDLSRPFYAARMVYDEQRRLVEVVQEDVAL